MLKAENSSACKHTIDTLCGADYTLSSQSLTTIVDLSNLTASSMVEFL